MSILESFASRKTMSKSYLFGCFASGVDVSIPIPEGSGALGYPDGAITGTITGIELESGFVHPSRPKHFLVTVVTERGIKTCVYVRTKE